MAIMGGGIVGGVVGTPDITTEGGIPKKESEIFVDSSITETATELTINKKLDVTGNVTTEGDVHIKGDAIVDCSITSTSVEELLVADNHILLNAGYTTVAALPGGLNVNYLPTTTNDTVSAGAFVAGIAATSNPTVTTVGTGIIAADSIVQFSDSAENDGVYEVLSHISNTLTIKGIGLTPTSVSFLKNQFIANASDAAIITVVNLSILCSAADGGWEVAKGSSTAGMVLNPLIFGNIGSDKEITFNDGGVIGSKAGFEYNKATDTLTVANITNTEIQANTTHRTSDGTDHTFIDQDVTSLGDPEFSSLSTPFGGLGRYQNLFTKSNEFSDPLWLKLGDNIPVVIQNDALGPNGELTADTITWSGPSSGILRQTKTLVNGTTYNLSVWLKLVSGSGIVTPRLGTDTGSNFQAISTWKRFDIDIAYTGGGGWSDFFVFPASTPTVCRMANAQISVGAGVLPYSGTNDIAQTEQLFGATIDGSVRSDFLDAKADGGLSTTRIKTNGAGTQIVLNNGTSDEVTISHED